MAASTLTKILGGAVLTYVGVQLFTPRTRKIIAALDEDPEHPLTSDDYRAAIVAAARSQLGQSDARIYWEDTLGTMVGPKHWCGGFALWALHAAGLGEDIDWKVGAGFCYRLPTTREPKPGDVAYFDRYQHHAIVVSADRETGELVTIDGNQPDVRERHRALNDAAAFYSVQGLIDARLKTSPGDEPKPADETPLIPTPLTKAEIRAALESAYLAIVGEPATDRALDMLTAQVRLETGNGGRMNNYNFANVMKGGASVPWYAPTPFESAYDDTRRIKFRSYATPIAGATDFLRQLQRNWPHAIAIAGTGSAEEYAAGLKKGRLGAFYTAPLEEYAGGLRGLLG